MKPIQTILHSDPQSTHINDEIEDIGADLTISVPHESNRIELSQIRIRFDRITNRI